MGYLLPADYAAYGLGPETPDALVTMAGALLEGHCRRPTLMAATYVERVRLMAGVQTARLSYGPLADGALQGVRVRFARPRRGEMELGEAGMGLDVNGQMVGQVAWAFGLPGAWSVLDVTTVDVYLGTRELTLPMNWLGLGYNEVEVTYTAGFVTVPEQIQAACAQVVKNALATPAMNVKGNRIDTMQMQYFSDSLLDSGVQELLRPYVAERL